MLVTENDMLKVADFGTSRFLEIAAHGTTVIGSPPYMAPEQFHGKAVFASDIYSLGVTMYQMLTGVLPYDTPAPADLDKLMSGELVTAAASRRTLRFQSRSATSSCARWRRRSAIVTSARRSCLQTCSRARASQARRTPTPAQPRSAS